mgnify:CR=1 FL=1
MGTLYLKLKREDEAEFSYRKAIELNPNPSGKILFWRGYLHEKNENYEKAIGDYSSAIKLSLIHI